jgi:hypothetical protein
MTDTSVTHDMTFRRWGCDYVFTPRECGRHGKLTGWHTPAPKVGDFLIMLHPAGGTTRYVVDSVENCGNPKDMFSASVTFAPRPKWPNNEGRG